MFKNKGILAFFIYYLVTLINDPIVLNYGIEGAATPRQFAIIAGVMIVWRYVKLDRESFFCRTIKWLFLFYFVCACSFSIFYILDKANENYLTTLLTNGANIIWIFTVGSALSQGITKDDITKFIYGILFLGLIPLLSGLYELSQSQHIMHGGFAERGVGSFFWVRGFHNDKVDFVSGLAPAVFVAFLLILRQRSKTWYLLPYFSLSMYVIFFSFSTTGILGVVSGLIFLILFFGTFRVKIGMLIVVVSTVLFLIVSINTDMGSFFIKQYLIKYEHQSNSETLQTGNARYAMGLICLREFINSPIFGVGFGGHVNIIYHELGGWGGQGNAHSILSVPADLGLTGTIPFFLFWAGLYAFVFRSITQLDRYHIDKDVSILLQLSSALSIFVIFRLLFYFHSIANASFIMWPALVYATSSWAASPVNMDDRFHRISKSNHTVHITSIKRLECRSWFL